MGKKESSGECASMMKVLADEIRLGVIRELMKGPKHVNEINDVLKIEQSLLSHHLKILRDAEMVESERDGKAVLYKLSPRVENKRTGRAINLGCCLISFE